MIHSGIAVVDVPAELGERDEIRVDVIDQELLMAKPKQYLMRPTSTGRCERTYLC